jgi:hypothetical protein
LADRVGPASEAVGLERESRLVEMGQADPRQLDLPACCLSKKCYSDLTSPTIDIASFPGRHTAGAFFCSLTLAVPGALALRGLRWRQAKLLCGGFVSPRCYVALMLEKRNRFPDA